jgi:hypothetical protein
MSDKTSRDWRIPVVLCAACLSMAAVLMIDIWRADPLGVAKLLASVGATLAWPTLGQIVGAGGAVFAIVCTGVCLRVLCRFSREPGPNGSAFEYRTQVYGLSGEKRTTFSKPLIFVMVAICCAVMALIFSYLIKS